MRGNKRGNAEGTPSERTRTRRGWKQHRGDGNEPSSAGEEYSCIARGQNGLIVFSVLFPKPASRSSALVNRRACTDLSPIANRTTARAPDRRRFGGPEASHVTALNGLSSGSRGTVPRGTRRKRDIWSYREQRRSDQILSSHDWRGFCCCCCC